MSNNILILDCDLEKGCDNTAKVIRTLLLNINKKQNVAISRICADRFPDSIANYTHIIITGSDANVYDDRPWINPLEKLIKKIIRQKIPLLGICFGHQIITKTIGGTIVCGKKEVGICKITKTKNNFLFKNIKNLKFYEYHQWYAQQKTKSSIILAKNKLCIQALKFNKYTYGVQFHPEVDIPLANRFTDEPAKTIAMRPSETIKYDQERKKIFINFLMLQKK